MFPPSFARLLLNVQLNLAQGGQGGQDMQNKEYTLGFSSSFKEVQLNLEQGWQGAGGKRTAGLALSQSANNRKP